MTVVVMTKKKQASGERLRSHRPKVRVAKTKALKQSEYRQRLDRQEIRPRVLVSSRAVELLIVLATKYGKLSRREAEARSRDRAWISSEIARLLEKLATDMGVPE
jgi:hypothetical protein